MQLSQSLKIKQKQSLVMTPQLQQAIKLLQLNNLELAQHLQEQVDENPFLELVKEEEKARHQPESHASEKEKTEVSDFDSSKPAAALADDPTENSDYENRFDQSTLEAHVARQDVSSFDGDYDALAGVSSSESVYQCLFRQLNLTIDNPKQRLIAGHFINSLLPSGWLGNPVEEIAISSGCSEEEAEEVLEKLQTFEPTGLFARDLADCLRLQLIENGDFTEAFAILLDNLELLGRGEVKKVAKLITSSEAEVIRMLGVIRTLNPKPGESLGIEYLEPPGPDVIVRKNAGSWVVDLNRSNLPSIEINERYVELIERRKNDTKAQDFAADSLNNARWLKRAVEQRNSTTLKISAEIIRQQTDFLDKGLDHLKPLSLRDIAEAVGMHESTVSRVTTGLLIATPRGSMPLKSFFSVNIASTRDSGSASAASVRNMVKRLISEEISGKPLSDEAICKAISKEGVTIARRTVAKYREMMNIPPSSQRRTQARLSNYMR
jgi:RNA polymerase sigma-54 factor